MVGEYSPTLNISLSPMIFSSLSTDGREICLDELLTAREQRAQIQQQLCQHYQHALLSVTLTAMGAVKKNALLDTIFADCLANLTACFQQLDIQPIAQHIRPLETGHEAFFVLPMEAMQLKQAMIGLEQQSPLGRLWDLDVFTPKGELLSRSDFAQPARQCLICEREAKLCARERRHTLDELIANMQRRVQAVQLAENIAKQVNQALLAEVNLTPKPGLVDQANSGAHQDMDITTFQHSCEALHPFWAKFVSLGVHFAHKSPQEMLPLIRPLGMDAEQAMFHATGGVNTHKGAIFIFGLVCCALGRLWLNQPSLFSESTTKLTLCQTVCGEVAEITQGITQELQNYPDHLPLTHGVRLFKHYGLTGARGAAEEGFPLVRTILNHMIHWNKDIMPVFSANELNFTSEFDLSHNAILGHIVLLWLVTHNQDTNIAHRGGLDGLSWIQQQANRILQDWQTHRSPHMLLSQLTELDQQCIERRLSAGGSADLLGLTLFFYFFTL